MEDKENSAPEVPVKVDEAPESYRIAPRTENPTELAGSFTLAAPATATAASPVSVAVSSTGMKKKRGRPRKYGPDGTVATALSPMPISSSIPLSGEFSAWKRGRGRPIESIKKSYKYEYESSGNLWFMFLLSEHFWVLKSSVLVTVGFLCSIILKIIICWYGYLVVDGQES